MCTNYYLDCTFPKILQSASSRLLPSWPAPPATPSSQSHVCVCVRASVLHCNLMTVYIVYSAHKICMVHSPCPTFRGVYQWDGVEGKWPRGGGVKGSRVCVCMYVCARARGRGGMTGGRGSRRALERPRVSESERVRQTGGMGWVGWPGDKPVQKLPCVTTPHSKLVQLWQ